MPFRFKLIYRNFFGSRMSGIIKEVPMGVILIQKFALACCPRRRFNRQLCYQSSILFLTYFAYMCYHLTRKPISVVKNVLHQNCSSLVPPPDIHINPSNNATWCDWAPFDGSDGDATALLGTLDSAFLFAYAIAMFFSGFVAERVNLRYFLSLGMILSGTFSYMFGIARTYDIHSMGYFVFVQAAAGIAQTTGWPGVVTIMGKWFGKGKRGLIFGIWNSHTSIGNILGTVIAARFVETDWSLSFIVPGLIMALGGFMIFLFLVEEPENVGLVTPEVTPGAASKHGAYRRLETGRGHASDENDQSESEEVLVGGEEHGASHRSHHRVPTEEYSINYSPEPTAVNRQPPPPCESTTLLSPPADVQMRAVGLLGALRIPGVIEFSLSLFFAKLVSYTFLYWLPLYIKNSTSLSPTTSADLSTCFDFGGIAGAILAGVLCDWSGMSATTCAFMLLLAAPMMMVYQWFGTINLGMNIFLLIVVGLLVNGPYALITTAVSAELGTHSSLEGNSKALATVTAIIDGTGSIGAAIGPMLAALVSSHGWAQVFYMLIFCDVLALILLLRLVKHEVARCRQHRNGPIE